MKKSTTVAAIGITMEAGLLCLANLAGTGTALRIATAQSPLKKAFWTFVGGAGLATSCYFSGAVAAQAAEMYTEAKHEEDSEEDSVEEF